MPIRAPIRKITKQSLIYGVGNVANKFVAILLIPVITRYLSIEDVGFVAIIEMVDILLISVFMLGMGNAVMRLLPGKSQSEQAEVISTIFWGRLLVDFALVTVFILLSTNLAYWIGFPERYIPLAPWMIVNAVVTVIGRYLLTIWRYYQQAQRFILLSLVQFGGALLLSIYFIMVLGSGAEGIVYARLIVYGLSAIITAGYMMIVFPSIPSRKIFRQASRFAYPLIPMAFVAPFLTTSDRYFLNQFVSLDQIGIYSIGYKFGMLLNILLVTPLKMAWIPMMFKMGLAKQSKAYYRDIIFYYTVIAAAIWVIITLLREEFIAVIATSDYLPGARYIPFIAAAYLINGYRHFFIAGSALKDKTIWLGVVSLIGIGCNIGLNYILIKLWGVWGATTSTLLSYLLLVILIYYVSHLQEPISWGWKRILTVFGWTSIFLVAIKQILPHLPGSSLIWDFLGMIIFILSLKLLGLLGPRELNGIRSLITLAWNKLPVKQ